MKKAIRFLSILLCLSLVLTLVGCQPEAPTTVSTQGIQATQTTQSTAPMNPAATMFDSAMDHLLKQKNVTLTVDRQDSMTVNGEEFTTSGRQCIAYTGLGTDSFAATVEDTTTFRHYVSRSSEVYTGGTVYSSYTEGNFQSKMTAQDYMARYLPLELVDRNLYTDCKLTDGVIYLDGGIAPEHWLNAEAEFVSSSATVTVGKDNKLESITCSVSYDLIGASIHSEITVSYSYPQPNTIEAPKESESYVSLSHIDAPRFTDHAYGFLLDAKSVSGSLMEMSVLQATGVYSTNHITWNADYQTGSLAAKVTTNYHVTDNVYNETLDTKLEELFLDGKYTIAEDGGANKPNSSVTTQIMGNYIDNLLTENLLGDGFFASAECTDLGSLLLLEFTCNDDFGQLINEIVCQGLYNDPHFLDNYASSFHTRKAEYYLSIDKYLGLPVAMGISFEGEHIIDGQPYKLIYQVDQVTSLASLDSYKAIHEEPLVGPQPEVPATPLFYKVTGPNGQELWLLGTIHVGDDRNCYLPQKIWDAFDSSDALAVECDPDAFDQQIEADPSLQATVSDAYYYSDGTTAKDHVEDEELYDLALKMMKATGNHNFNTPYLKIAAWSNSINNFFLQQSHCLSSDKGVDNLLMAEAQKQEKKIYEVENTLFQLQMLTGWSKDLSLSLLADAVQSEAVSYRESILYLYDLWCQGDEKALIDYMTDDTTGMTDEELKLYNEYNQAMSWDRNKGMVQKAIEYLESGETIFYAVGLAHVIAEDGLVNALRDAGYTVELVEFE